MSTKNTCKSVHKLYILGGSFKFSIRFDWGCFVHNKLMSPKIINIMEPNLHIPRKKTCLMERGGGGIHHAQTGFRMVNILISDQFDTCIENINIDKTCFDKNNSYFFND